MGNALERFTDALTHVGNKLNRFYGGPKQPAEPSVAEQLIPKGGRGAAIFFGPSERAPVTQAVPSQIPTEQIVTQP